MNVSLTPELERLVSEKVETGLYQTASEVVRDGLRLLKLRDERELRADVRAGFDAVGRGEYSEYTPASLGTLATKVKARGRRGTAAAKKTKSR